MRKKVEKKAEEIETLKSEDVNTMSQVASETPVVTQTVPKILFEILLYGTNKQKKTIQRVLADLTKQMDSHRKAKSRARVLWYIDDGEKLTEDKKQWLIEHSNCKYSLFIGEDDLSFAIKSDFVKTHLAYIEKLEKSVADLKKAQIFLRPKDVESKAQAKTDTKLKVLK